MLKLFIAFCFLFANKTATLHPVYVSVAEIEYKPQKQSLEIGLKIFSDDLSTALSMENQQLIEIGTEREHKDATILLQKYIKKHFYLYVNEKNVELEYIGREFIRQDFFAVWVYFEVRNVENLNNLYIKNTILQELFATQNNIINFRYNGKTKRASLYAHKPNAEFNIK